MDPIQQVTDVLGGPGGAMGSVAARLMASGLNVNALRTNDVLRKEEWLLFDRTVLQVARPRLVAVGDLMSRGLTMPIANAMGITVVQHETSSDMTDAEINMTGLADTQRDRLEFSPVNTPLPIIHKDFQLSLRVLTAGRRMGQPLDTTTAGIAARKVADAMESMLFNGATVTLGGGTIYGYRTHPSRNTGSTTASWATQGGEAILADLLAMIDKAVTDNMFGPYVLYVSTGSFVNMLEDFKAASDKSTIQRLMEVPQLAAIRPTTQIASGDEVVLVQMATDTIDWLDGQQPTTVMWETHGGMMINFKVLAIGAPRPKADQEGRSGIVHYT
jgi:uncharacterized linocin/CFP29 family protein